MVRLVLVFLFSFLFPFNLVALEVNISRHLVSFTVEHDGKTILIQRNQDTQHMIAPDFALTSRPCPPFCAQPMEAAPGVVTIGELELLRFMRTQLDNGSGLLIDSRTPDWYVRGTIPGSVNIPFNHLNPAHGADEITLEDSLALLGVYPLDEEGWDFSRAKTVALWCNGPWCGQSPLAVKGLVSIGYPKDKVLYYRGGMQMWQLFGLPVVTPDGRVIELE